MKWLAFGITVFLCAAAIAEPVSCVIVRKSDRGVRFTNFDSSEKEVTIISDLSQEAALNLTIDHCGAELAKCSQKEKEKETGIQCLLWKVKIGPTCPIEIGSEGKEGEGRSVGSGVSHCSSGPLYQALSRISSNLGISKYIEDEYSRRTKDSGKNGWEAKVKKAKK